MIYLITEMDLEYSSLDQSDLGKWCYIVMGVYMVFNTKKEALKSYNNIMGDQL